jgi:hypothetical protein
MNLSLLTGFLFFPLGVSVHIYNKRVKMCQRTWDI